MNFAIEMMNFVCKMMNVGHLEQPSGFFRLELLILIQCKSILLKM